MKILFINRLHGSFIRQDLALLRSLGHEVDAVEAGSLRELVLSWRKVASLFAGHYDVYFSWWSTSFYTVLFAKLFGAKSIIVTGGFDVVYLPAIDYGFPKNWFAKALVKFTLQNADLVLPFSEYSAQQVERLVRPRNMVTVRCGIPIDHFPFCCEKDGSTVLTVCLLSDANVRRKGIENYVKVAARFPEKTFLVVGKLAGSMAEKLRSSASPNVVFTGELPDKELIKWFCKATVYCQLSYQEGFGVAAVEAAACGCVPVVTGIGGLREMLLNGAVYAEYGNLVSIERAIRKALSPTGKEVAGHARRRAEELSAERRKEKLSTLIKEISKV